jgi:hypothetical protein
MKDPVTVCKAKSILEKALAQDEMYLPAVYLLAEIYEQVIYSFQTLLSPLVPYQNIMCTVDEIWNYMLQTSAHSTVVY